MRRVTTLFVGGALAFGCTGVQPPPGLLGDLVGRTFGLPNSELPPIYTACGRAQPGYDPGDPGDPNAHPPRERTPPSLNGEPYDELQDPFCTITFTREYTQDEDDGTVFIDEDIYVVEIGDADEDSPEWDPGYMFEGGLYCSWRWKARSIADPLTDPYEQEEVQLIEWTMVSVSDRCANTTYVPGYPQREYAIRSTREDTVLFLTDSFAVWQGHRDDGGALLPDVRFQGYAGISEGGGGMAWPDLETTEGDEGWMTYYKECEPASDGYCHPPTCRLFSESTSLPACTWDDVAAAPHDRNLVHPEWAAGYPTLEATTYATSREAP